MPTSSASATWEGGLRQGRGHFSAGSKAFEADYSFRTRFEGATGTNPEELIAAAHAACYSMAFANYLSGQGHTPEEIRTQATITLDNGSINKMHLVTQGRVPGLDQGAFQRLAEEADKKCPVSNLLRNGLAITIEASLLERLVVGMNLLAVQHLAGRVAHDAAGHHVHGRVDIGRRLRIRLAGRKGVLEHLWLGQRGRAAVAYAPQRDSHAIVGLHASDDRDRSRHIVVPAQIHVGRVDRRVGAGLIA